MREATRLRTLRNLRRLNAQDKLITRMGLMRQDGRLFDNNGIAMGFGLRIHKLFLRENDLTLTNRCDDFTLELPVGKRGVMAMAVHVFRL